MPVARISLVSVLKSYQPGSWHGTRSPAYLDGMQRGYTALYFTDNQFLEIIVQIGIFGLLSFFGFVVSAYLYLIEKAQKKDIMALAAGGVFTAFLVAGIFANVLEFGAIALPTGIILGVAFSD